MRIISGALGGRRIKPPANMPHTRPTTDIAREGLFNILQHRIAFDGARTLDLFGGTGAISYELASRGAADLTIVEQDSTMYDFIRANLAALKIDNAKVVRVEVFSFLRSLAAGSDPYDIIFAGPPYALTTIDELPREITGRKLIADGGWFIMEHTARNSYKGFEGFEFERNYGGTVFSFFQ